MLRIPRVKINDEILWKVQRAVEILGGRTELGRKLGYVASQPDKSVEQILNRRNKTMSAQQLQIIDDILNGVIRSANERNDPDMKLDTPIFHCMTNDSCPFKTTEYRKQYIYRKRAYSSVQTCGKRGYCGFQGFTKLYI